MIHYKTNMLLTFALLTMAVAYGQDPHVYSEYKEQLKATIVYTDKMYLLNTPDHVIEVELNFRLKQKQSQRQPERVDLILWSYSHELKYRKDEGRDISLIADGDMLKVAKVNYMPFQKGKKNYERIKDAYAEWIILYFSPDEMRKLAIAKIIKLRMGNQELDFKDVYMNTIRDFASRIPQQ